MSSKKRKINSIYGKDKEIRESIIRQVTLETDLEDGHFSRGKSISQYSG